ncbi:MAG: NAD(P)/FAD-dependent oxidoreductase [Lachnospiraceae bacterium]|nr:NAD(P)/FAD-dependent oxidoreductase [Lachnospiraceae bacterium]
MSKVIVIGGGAAGMMAAIWSARNNNNVILIEQNEKMGKKLFITGKGRCNFTNACELEDFFGNVVSNPKFMYSPFYSFSNKQVMDFFEELGLRYKVERGNRVFPASDHSSDVIKVLEKELRRLNVDIRLNTKVDELVIDNNVVGGVCVHEMTNSNVNIRNSQKNNDIDNKNICNNDGNGKSTNKRKTYKLTADKVIIATGGISYPRTGASDSGYRFAKDAGHLIVDLKPSLVPFEVKEKWCKDLMGVSLKNVGMEIFVKDDKGKEKKIFNDFGEMLFTHFGVSGPMVIKASASIHKYLGKDIVLSIDLKPALSEKQLDDRILRDFEMFRNRQLNNGLEKLLLKSLIPVIVECSGIAGEKKISEITKEERRILGETVKNLKMHVTGLRGWDEAIVTKGGVSVKEIEPKTMESKIVKGLYFAGEVIDVDALTGGFNLQVAWSTAYLAGISK